MPALPNVPNVVRHTLRFDLGGDLDVINRFFQQYSTPPLSDPGAGTWAAAVSASWNAHMAPFHNPGLSLVQVTTEDLTSASGAVGTSAAVHAGSDAGAVLSAGAAFVIKQHISRRYRGGHPRQYLAGFSQSRLGTSQAWDAAFVGNVATAYTAFRVACAAGAPPGVGLVVDANVSYFAGFHNFTFPSGRTRPIATLRAVPVVDVITAWSGNPKVGSQRRRNLQSA